VVMTCFGCRSSGRRVRRTWLAARGSNTAAVRGVHPHRSGSLLEAGRCLGAARRSYRRPTAAAGRPGFGLRSTTAGLGDSVGITTRRRLVGAPVPAPVVSCVVGRRAGWSCTLSR
jgi:hypothetical protein